MIKFILVFFAYTAVMLALRWLGDVKIPYKWIFIPAAAGGMLVALLSVIAAGIQAIGF